METCKLSAAMMHMLQERAQCQKDALDAQVMSLKQIRDDVNSPTTKAELNGLIDNLTRRSTGLEIISSGFFANTTQEKWIGFLVDMDELEKTNCDGYEEVCKLCRVHGDCSWMQEMFTTI